MEDIKSRLGIEDVVSEYVQLKRAGRNWKGLSPWTNERSPSFIVSPEKQIWHDFSSGRGGDMFSFVMEMEGLDFKGALELLARKAGVNLEQYRTSGQSGGDNKERLYAVLDAAARFYQVQFSKHMPALEYVLKKRAFSKQTALEWRLGYSPSDGTALCDFLRGKGFSEHHIKTAGLSAQRYRGLGDMFRGRIMIPLCDPQGRVIGFTARLLADDPNAPKYINTPQTPLYDKSRHVFGLHLAKDAIRKNKFAVIAEGNLDVIASHQAGVRQVVATAGTALTEYQLKALGRFTPDIRLSFDADTAGINATERAIPIASKVGVSLSIITIPSGKDPDELIRQDKSTWEQIIQQPQYALDWLMERYQKELDITSAQGKRQFSDVILAVVGGLADPVEREHYLHKVAQVIQVSHETLQAKMAAKTEAPRRLRQVTPPAFDKTVAELLKIQNHLLTVALFAPAVRPLLSKIRLQMLPDQPARELWSMLQANPTLASDSPKLASLEDYVKMATLLYEELYQDIDALELNNEAVRLQDNLVRQYVNTQKQRIARELATADDARSQQLLEAAKKLDALLKK